MVAYMPRGRIPRIIADPALDYQRSLVFAPSDRYGNAGYAGVVQAYNRDVGALPRPDAISSVGYAREILDTVPPAVDEAKGFLEGVLARAPEEGAEPVAIVMIDTYGPGDLFIRGVRDWINAD